MRNVTGHSMLGDVTVREIISAYMEDTLNWFVSGCSHQHSTPQATEDAMSQDRLCFPLYCIYSNVLPAKSDSDIMFC